MELAGKYAPKVAEFLQTDVKHGVEKADVGRLLALAYEGGVYIDSDVTDMSPVWSWPEAFHHEKTGYDLVLGVEQPTATNGNPLQITNWAMAAMPRNPVMLHAIEKITSQAHNIADTSENIIRRTGPAALTAAILERLQDYGAKLPDMSAFREGDGHVFNLPQADGTTMKLLLLPYRAFGYHPNNVGPEYGLNRKKAHLLRHGFYGRWRPGYKGIPE